MRGLLIGGSIIVGAVIAVLAFLNLQKTGQAAHHKNPFALQRSAYGTTLARLGQKNLDRAWHYGAVASAISQRDGDEHAGHGHEEEKVRDEHADHDHEGEHDHREEELERESWVESALQFLVALDAERFRRTSHVPLTEAQERVIAWDIESLLLRGYNMDPTDYGVYDSYFHFLLYHPLRGGEARKHAYGLSEHTIKMAGGQKTDPMPFLTSAIATLNQFFIQQYDYRSEKKDDNANLPNEVLARYQERMKYCMTNYFFLKKKAVEEGRWDLISMARRVEGDERARQGMKMMEQFAAMIERGNGTAAEGKAKNKAVDE